MTQPLPSVKPPQHSRANLRKTLLDQRRTTEAGLRQQWDAQIIERLIDWCQRERPASLGVFWPIQAEPDLRNSYQRLHDMGIMLALPSVMTKAQPLTFLQWIPGETMSTDDYGIPVPARREPMLHPKALLIPCVGFNAGQYRLGYGGGYYDRTLAIAPRPFAIGIAYDLGLSDFIAQAHDIAMDKIITETI